jgi:hypothetical protein
MDIREILQECQLLIFDMQPLAEGQQLTDLKQLEFRIGEALISDSDNSEALKELQKHHDGLTKAYDRIKSDIETLYNSI